ncbi:probable Mitochondrial Rho GTPase 1 [Pseudozyma flocculosa]|uniref:Mitochondrial Rho GTPase 1 n=1 Tax=Pseudozyma flocculosa TaxID=84751 RepID=A0A5C3F2L3_9BASI|nr:probable Mitochondrial Rho GTPase 1 [Pseudozyma flocculosa]
MRRDVRIVLAGDPDVGKSTLITSLVKEAYVAKVQKVVPHITLPPEVAPEGVVTKIVDTNSNPEHRTNLEAELRRANVICIVYSISAPSSFDRIPTYWLPYIRSLGINVPVILVGNKIDLRSGDVTNAALEDELAPVMAEFKEVETCVECSAKIPLNVSEVFYFAQKAVLYPTAPLYDSREHALKPACVDALKRIFRLCDSDKDGLLSDAELNDFQRKCFDAPLQLSELEGIKDLVAQAPIGGPYFNLYDGSGSAAASTSSSAHNGAAGFDAASSHHPHHSQQHQQHPHLRDGSLTMAGFLYLHTLFIQRGRLETTWTVLRSFGYGADLTLEDSFVKPPFAVPAECSVELSPHGYQFLTDIFEAYDKDRDGALCAAELDHLFLLAPDGRHPWEGTGFPESTITDENGAVTLQGWLAQWSMTTLLDHRTTLAYLAYLGYPSFPQTGGGAAGGSGAGGAGGRGTSGRFVPSPIPLSPSGPPGSRGSRNHTPSPPPVTTALKLTRPRRADRKKKGAVQRSTFLGFVLGAAGSGKTAILRNMVGKRFEPAYEPTQKMMSVVSTVEQAGAERYLVLQEFGSRYEAEVLRNSSKLSAADVVVFVYDSSDTNSFSYISNLRQQYPLLQSMPSLFVATKADLDLAQQRHEVQPDAYCRKLGLKIPGLGAGPLSVSMRDGQVADLYGLVCGIAVDARGAVQGGNESKALSFATNRWVFWGYVVVAVLGGSGAAYVGFRLLHPNAVGLSSSSSSGGWRPWWSPASSASPRSSVGGAGTHGGAGAGQGGGWLEWLWRQSASGSTGRSEL